MCMHTYGVTRSILETRSGLKGKPSEKTGLLDPSPLIQRRAWRVTRQWRKGQHHSSTSRTILEQRNKQRRPATLPIKRLFSKIALTTIAGVDQTSQ